MRKPIVWIVKEQVRRTGSSGVEAMDYTPAMKYGEIRFITQSDPPSFITKSSVLEAWSNSVERFMEEFNPQLDFIIASGQPTAMMMVGWLIGDTLAGFDRHPPRFLLWRREENTYIPYDPLSQIIKG